MKKLTINEEILLLVIWRLDQDAYGVTIQEKVSELTGMDFRFGALYNHLEQLTRKGYVTSYKGDPTAMRGGKRKVFYQITKAGREALESARALHEKLWENVPRLA